MKTNYFGYIVNMEEEFIHLGKLTAPNWKKAASNYSHASEYIGWKSFRMDRVLSIKIHMYFSIGQYVRVTAEGKEVKAILLLTDSVLINEILRTTGRKKRDSIRYADMRQQGNKFLDVTGLTVEEFDQLVPAFEELFEKRMSNWCIGGNKRVGRRYFVPKNAFLPTPEDRLLFILVYLRSRSLQELQEELVGTEQSCVSSWVRTLLIVLQTTLRTLENEPYRSLKELTQQLEVKAIVSEHT